LKKILYENYTTLKMNTQQQTNNKPLICKAIKKNGCKCSNKANPLYGSFCGIHKKNAILEQKEILTKELDEEEDKKKKRAESDKKLKEIYDGMYPITLYTFYNMNGKNYEIETNNNKTIQEIIKLLKVKYELSYKIELLVYVEGSEEPLHKWDLLNTTNKYFIVEQLRTELTDTLAYFQNTEFTGMMKYYIMKHYRYFRISRKVETSKDLFDEFYNYEFQKCLNDRELYADMEESIKFWNGKGKWATHCYRYVKNNYYKIFTKFDLKKADAEDIINNAIKQQIKNSGFDEYDEDIVFD